MRHVKQPSFVCTLSLAVLVSLSAGIGLAQEAAEEELPPGTTPEMMQAWATAATPGPEHAMLADMAGKWNFTGTFVMAPGAPPQTATGTSERKMILGGRVLVEKARSEMLGQKFEGMGLTGYDNVSGEYWGTWNDNMGTGLMVSTGSCGEDGSCEFVGTYNDPFVDGPKTLRVTMSSDGDTEVHKAYDKTPEGEEFLSMELVYTRAEAEEAEE